MEEYGDNAWKLRSSSIAILVGFLSGCVRVRGSGPVRVRVRVSGPVRVRVIGYIINRKLVKIISIFS